MNGGGNWGMGYNNGGWMGNDQSLGPRFDRRGQVQLLFFFYRVTHQLFTEIYLNCDFIQLYFQATKYHQKCIMRTLS